MRFCNQCMEEIHEEIICPHCGNDTRKKPDIPYALQPGTVLNGKYLVGNVLGQGGFGITYIGLDLALEIKVAIKEYYVAGIASRMEGKTQQVYWAQDPGNMNHFITEARRMAKLEKLPEVALVRDVFYANNTAYIIMEYVRGQSLKHYLQKNGPMSWEQTIRLMLPVISALGRVHEKNLIHRDISPDNLMMEPDGNLRVLDLGAAGDLSRNNGQASQLVARKGFSPYEQYMENGNIGPWTDVYAMCATIYYCCTGKVIPDAYTRVDRLINTQDGQIQMDAVIPHAGAEVLQKGLALNVTHRISSMQELAAQLDASLAKRVQPSPQVKPDPIAVPQTSAYVPEIRTAKPDERKLRIQANSTPAANPYLPAARPKRPRIIAGCLIVAALILVLTLVFGRFGWYQYGDTYRYYNFGFPAKGWAEIDGNYYHFDEHGNMHTGWQIIDGNNYYFGKTDGVMRTGWQKISGYTFYFGRSDGVKRTGWQEIGGNTYYFGKFDGNMRTGRHTIGGKMYLFDDKGILQSER